MIKRISSSHANAFTRRRHLIIGNGPSFNPDFLSSLASASTTTFVCNNFLRSAHHPSFVPTFYCLADPDYADADRFADGDLKGFYKELFSKYPYTTILTSEGIANYISANFSKSSYGVNILWSPFCSGFKYPDQYAIRLDISLEPFLNVLLMMLQFSFYFGGKDIELHGFDFTSIFLYAFVDGRKAGHFYEANQYGTLGMHHGLQPAVSVESLLQSFRGNLGLSEQLYRIRQTAALLQIRIKNCSQSSLLPPLSPFS
jgi:hypothetical protein